MPSQFDREDFGHIGRLLPSALGESVELQMNRRLIGQSIVFTQGKAELLVDLADEAVAERFILMLVASDEVQRPPAEVPLRQVERLPRLLARISAREASDCRFGLGSDELVTRDGSGNDNEQNVTLPLIEHLLKLIALDRRGPLIDALPLVEPRHDEQRRDVVYGFALIRLTLGSLGKLD